MVGRRPSFWEGNFSRATSFEPFSSQSSDPFMDPGSNQSDLDEQLAFKNITWVIFPTTSFVHMIYVTSVASHDID